MNECRRLVQISLDFVHNLKGFDHQTVTFTKCSPTFR